MNYFAIVRAALMLVSCSGNGHITTNMPAASPI